MKAGELKQMMAEGKPVRILDVREADEFSAGDTIPGAQNVPMGKVFVQASKGELPKDQKLVTICKSGARCQIVARELKERGYDIDYLEGGLQEWK